MKSIKEYILDAINITHYMIMKIEINIIGNKN